MWLVNQNSLTLTSLYLRQDVSRDGVELSISVAAAATSCASLGEQHGVKQQLRLLKFLGDVCVLVHPKHLRQL